MNRLVVACSVAALVSSSAFAGDIPRFDVEAECTAVANAGGTFSEMIYGGCFDQEQSSYNALKDVWASLPDGIKAECVVVAKAGGAGSYMILNGCIEQEISAKSSNAGKEFKF